MTWTPAPETWAKVRDLPPDVVLSLVDLKDNGIYGDVLLRCLNRGWLVRVELGRYRRTEVGEEGIVSR